MSLKQIPALLLFMVCGGCQSVSPPPAMREATGVSLLGQKMMTLVTRQSAIFRLIDNKRDPLEEGGLQLRLNELIHEWELLLTNNPDEVTAYIFYGKLLRRVDKNEHANRMFMKANRLDPNIAVVHQQIGNYLAEDSDYGLALGYFLKAIELSPKTALYSFQLGELLFHFRDQYVADKILDRSTLEHQMLTAYKVAAQLESDNRDFQFRYAEAFYDLETPDWEAALSAWKAVEKSVQPGLETEAVQLHRAKALAHIGRLAEAQALAEAVTEPSLQKSKEQVLDQLIEKAK